MSTDEEEIQQKTWRAVYQSLSEEISSDMPIHTDVPGTLAANKSLSGAKIRRIFENINFLGKNLILCQFFIDISSPNSSAKSVILTDCSSCQSSRVNCPVISVKSLLRKNVDSVMVFIPPAVSTR